MRIGFEIFFRLILNKFIFKWNELQNIFYK